MKTGLVSALCLTPSLSYAAAASGEFSFISSLLQMIAALAIVVGLILVSWYAVNRLNSGVSTRLPAKHIRVLETRYLSPKKSLILIEVGGEYLLLSSSEGTVSLLKQVNILEEIEILDDSPGRPAGIADLLARFLKR